MSVTREGAITTITFQNEDTGYTVLHLKTTIDGSVITCVGTMPTAAPGESIKVFGEWESHKKFGPQFAVSSYEIIRPTTLDGIIHLLSSGLFSNIGPVRAQLIVETFGLDTLVVLDDHPERLLEVRGIGAKTVKIIKEAWDRQRHIRDLMLFLQTIGVSTTMATRIYKVYGAQAREKISGNPYALLDDVWGIGFIRADKIAQNLGFAHDSYKRIRAGLMYVLMDAAGNGHSYLPFQELTTLSTEILGVSPEIVLYTLDHSLQSKLLINENDCVYLPIYYYAEKKVAEELRIKSSAPKNPAIDQVKKNALEAWIKNYEQSRKWQADKRQVEAITAALHCGIFLLTGGPGTGKTTILQVIVSYFREHQKVVTLAAPTGRAAQRMGNLAGLKASTIHRLLEFRPGDLENRFGRNEKNPLDTDILIIDEMSMIDILLMRSLLAALRPGTSIVFVGDNHQLPSVGAGNVLADLIASGTIAHVHLSTVFRQAASSRIVTAAHEIIAGITPAFINSKEDNCFFIAEEEPAACVSTIIDLVSRRLPLRYGLNPITDIQVLSPMHKGELGTQSLTTQLQNALNPGEKKIVRGMNTFAEGDKVMQLRNNYDKGVFNGDIGTITQLIDNDSLRVDFDGTEISYDMKDLDELVPAYCISIHKSQGCEFKAVVIPLVTQHFIMLQRNLIYTALTRARELCVLVGTGKALSIAVRNNQAINRYSGLAKRLLLNSA